MIDYIKGSIAYKNPTDVTIDINGLGYKIFISLYTYSKIQTLEKVKLYTYLQIKEDGHSLFGFFDIDERNIFLNLINISGVGANTARLMLSALSPLEIYKIIITANTPALEKVKGIGKKTAERIILELKDKLLKQKPLQSLDTTNNPDTDNSSTSANKTNTEINSTSTQDIYVIKTDATAALIALGINRTLAENVINKIITANIKFNGLEELIKMALQSL